MKKTNNGKLMILLFLILAMLFSSAAHITVYSAENAAVSADCVKANPGDTVDVKIRISNNPGIVSATIRVTFDNTVLTLLKVTDSDILGSQAHKPELVSPYTLAWVNDTATSNYSDNGIIATLTFKVSDTVEEEKLYPIELSYDYNNYDIYDKDLNPILFDMIDGGVEISKSPVILGDVNNDGTVDILDAVLVQKYAVDKVDLSDDQKFVADVNHDGVVDILDAIQIQKFAVDKISDF